MTTSPMPDDDPYLWLEDVHGERALAWVAERNAESRAATVSTEGFAALQQQLLEVLQASDRIPSITRRGGHVYNLWQDADHLRGLWRRTTLDEYKRDAPPWETVLDLDALGVAEGESWVWGGATSLPPEHARCLVSLSRGGSDATVVREFDTVAKCFVDGGYALPEAKSQVHWLDRDRLYVGTDTGPGSMTDSGYPRTVRLWRRGTALADAPVVFEGEPTDVAADVTVDATPGHRRVWFTRSTDFFHSLSFLQRPIGLIPIDVPDDASFAFMRDTLLLHLRSELHIGDQRFPAGSLLQADAEAWLRGERRAQALFTPTATRSLESYTTTADHVVLTVMDNVAATLDAWRKEGSRFVRVALPPPVEGGLANLQVASLHDCHVADDPLAEALLVGYTDFTTPDTLFLLDAAGAAPPERLKARRPLFDADGMRAEQRFATSADGTRVPYFVVWPAGATADGDNPTLLYGYGGFEISLSPWYSGTFGRAWSARGGVLVVANIRGGGEYGPLWHQAAIKAHKQRSYDDFIAVAEDLVARRVTSPRRLGIMGGSNGGLLVGAVMTQRPDLFGAVVCQVPLLDMRRYHLLLAGASWMGEYGNPDAPEEWTYIGAYSPYHHVRAGTAYPHVLFATSTRDDRVHPGHARKMAARMLAQGHDVLYYENTEGGHGGAADSRQRAHLQAIEFTDLWRQLGR